MAEDKRSDEEKALAIRASEEYLRVSYSSLGVHEGCERKFEFNKLYPQRPRMFDSFPADVGTALHRGFQNYLIHGNEDAAMWAMAAAFPYELEYQQDKDYRSLEACVSTLEWMMECSVFGDYELAQIIRPATFAELAANPDVLTYQVPAIEVPYEIRFKGLQMPDGRGLAHVGYMDAIMRHKVTGDFRTLDIKTHRRTMGDAEGVYKFNGQQVPYGICIEHIQGNPVQDFEVLYYDVFIDLLNPKVTPYSYRKDSDDVQEWLTNTVLQMQRIIRSAEMDYFPRTSGGCVSWNKPCYFLEVCQSRDRKDIEFFMLMGEEPAVPRYEIPWIVSEIDVFGGAG